MTIAGLPPLVPAQSLHQPYASLVAFGQKTIETRKHRILYRGPLLICATLTFDEAAWCRIRSTEKFDALGMIMRGHKAAFGSTLPRGVALAVVDVVGCRPLEPEDEPISFFYEPGRWAWLLENPRRVQPVRVRGHQGRFTVARELLELEGRADCPICKGAGEAHGRRCPNCAPLVRSAP